MSSAHIVIDSLNHHFGEGELRRQILFDINTEIHPGEIILLTGPSGSGKTTLLTLVGALRTTQSGSLRVLGRELMGADENTLTDVRKRIGYIFQSHNLLEALTAQQNVQMTLQLQPRLTQAQHIQLTEETLTSVGLDDKLNSHPSELSGGQRQRVAIARALVGQPDMILADEPTASLDRRTGREIVELLQQLARQKAVTVVLVTHDIGRRAVVFTHEYCHHRLTTYDAYAGPGYPQGLPGSACGPDEPGRVQPDAVPDYR